jgi:hypothetical protein
LQNDQGTNASSIRSFLIGLLTGSQERTKFAAAGVGQTTIFFVWRDDSRVEIKES